MKRVSMNSNERSAHRNALLFALSFALRLGAQDVHFSQFNLSPLVVNPAQAGAIKDDQRFTLNYRDQWRSLGSPFTTYAASYDLPILRGKMNGRYIGLGGHAFQDKAGASAFGTLNAGLTVAYDLKLSRLGELAFGLQGAYGQRSATLDGLSWDSQYTGTNYDPSLPTGEVVFNQRIVYIDLAAGLLWRHVLLGHETALGAAVHHPHQPTVTLLGDGRDPLLMRITLHGEVRMESDTWTVIPRFLASKQGGATELVLGAMAEHTIGTSSRFTDARTGSAFLFGCSYRWNDAVVPAMQLDYHRFLSIGISYDLNISRLRAQSHLQGGMEIALVYHGAFSDQRRKLKGRTPQQR